MKNIAGASGGGEDKRLKKNCEYILIYAKDYIYLQPFKNVYDYVEIGELLERYKRENISWKYTSVFLDEGQKHYLTSTVGGDGNEIKIFEHKNYTIKSIETVAKETGITEKEVYYKYIDKIIRTSLPQSSIRPRVMQKLNEQHYINDLVSIEYVPKTGKNKGKTYVQYYKGNSYNLVVWLSDTVEKKENGFIYKKTKKGTYWNYASSTNNLTKEGNVRFPNGKKPEALIETILNLSTKENDLVMDIFLGSGTTCAVAHKMKRRYIGIEKENHIITHVIPRLRGIIDTCTHIQAQENKSKSKSKNTSINTDIDMDMDIPIEDSFKNGYRFYALDNDIDRLLLIANSDNDDKNKKTSFLNKDYPQQLSLIF